MSPSAWARAEAATAAREADVDITEVATPDELDVLRSTMESIWGPEIVPPRNLLRGMALSGNCLLVARRGGEAIGFALGWLGWADGVHFHSHQVGVRDGIRGAGIGFALKLAQRALCLQHGITEMRWTYDPMLASNARFNMVRLGAQAVDFIPHCYGDRRDAFNTGERTDRLEVSWRLDAPIGGRMVEPAGREVVEIPAAYQTLRATDPGAAAASRERVGSVLSDVFENGGGIAGYREGGYVIERGGGA